MADEKDPKKAAAEPAPAAEAPAAPEGKDGKAPKKKLKISFSNFSPREKFLLNISAAALVALAMDLFIIHPIGNYLRKINETIALKEEQIPKNLLILKYKDKIMMEYKSIQSLETNPSLSQEEEIAQLLREIERVSKEAGVFVSNINPVKVNKKSEMIYEMTVDIEGNGGFGEVKKFMKIIETANPSIRIGGFTLKPQGKESDEIKFMFSVFKIGVRHPATAPAQ